MNSPASSTPRPALPLWLPNTALVLTLLIALVRAGSVSTTPFALVIAVLAVLSASALAMSEQEGGSLAWGVLIKHLLGPVVLPVYGLAAAGMLYLGSSSGPGLGGAAHGMNAHAATLAAPSLCGGSCGSGAGCGSGGCGASGGKGGACGCSSGKKTQTAAKTPISAAELQARAAAVQQRTMQPPAAVANLPGIQMTPPAGAVPVMPARPLPARPLPPGLVPKAGMPLPPGVMAAAPVSKIVPLSAVPQPPAPAAPVPVPNTVTAPAAVQPSPVPVPAPTPAPAKPQ